ncbi:hypothetical protein M422DRAFT_83769, partial [Sphaerobolus stellatus SS14]
REHKEAFIAKLGERAVVKDRNIPIVVEFVPVGFDPTNEVEIEIAENDSGLPINSLMSARWIKPVERRHDGQKVAHMIIRAMGAEAANQILRDGLVIRGKRVRARKMTKEPRRCLKCQKIDANHLAANCDTEKDVCGTCGKEHRTKNCLEKDKDKYKCTNCRIYGHASWDRSCPSYTQTAAKLRRRDTEVTYRYIPTSEPWTW